MSMTLLGSDGREVVPIRRSSARRFIVLGLIVVVILFGGIGTWAATAQLSSAAIAPGVVAVDTNWRTIQHLEGGIVAAIFVRDGDYVEEGDLLLRLDATRAEASITIIEGQLDLALATEARLIAERDGADAIVFPTGLFERHGEPEVAMIMSGQELLFVARRDSLAGQVSILNQRIDQLRNQIKGLEVQQSASYAQITLIEQELDGLRELYDEGYVTRSRILALERESERLRGERGEDLAAIAESEAAIGEASLQILQLEKGLREEVVAELRDVQSEIFDLEQRQIGAADILNRIEVRAPSSGTVLGLNAHTVGGVISPGDDIMNIVPEGDPLIIEARVQPNDIENVITGQTAEVRFSGLSQRDTPTLNGQVLTISADRLTDQQRGEDYYEARVIIPQDEIERLNDVELVPGMPAEVMILTGERTALNYLLEPIQAGLNRSFRE
ncbi:MAG: HlyD family type I secretion periplasmic adaptor subunit [Pseudomonadota bacterium]